MYVNYNIYIIKLIMQKFNEVLWKFKLWYNLAVNNLVKMEE